MRFRGLGPEIYTLPVINQLPKVKPMPLVERSEPFNHPEWIYEIKYDGFRALACDDGQCQLVSRKGNIYKNFSELCDSKSNDRFRLRLCEKSKTSLI